MDDASPAKDPVLDFDPDALREKYRQERDKRLRADGEAQYVEVSGPFARYAEEDPYADPDFTRAPLTDDVEVVIIGGGFSGLLAAARLREAGVNDFRIVEAGGDFGGTWYWNRYPGAQCDIESYCYLPLLEELGYIPKEKYSYVGEIFEHSQRIGQAYHLYDVTYFQTRVNALSWDEGLKRWRIRTNRGDDMKARFVVMALGTASRAKLPGIPGLEEFEGHSFHTSRWDYDYTGGDTTGNLTKLGDKRVAVIGTGATAIQCVPYVGKYAEHLYVFQRTPSSVDLRGNKPTDDDWAKSLEPGWQRARRHNFADIVEGRPFTEDLVNDSWIDIFRSLAAGFRAAASRGEKLSPQEAAKQAELADFAKMNKVRARVDESVKDPTVAEALKPWYRQFCKRPTFNDEFLPAFNRPSRKRHAGGRERSQGRRTDHEGRAWWRTGSSIPSTASSTPGASGSRRRKPPKSASRSPAGRGCRSTITTKTASAPCTVIPAGNFPNWFYIGIGQERASSVNMTAMFDDQAEAHCLHHRRGEGAGGGDGGADGRGGGGLGGDDPLGGDPPRLPERLHARLLQQRGR